MQSPPDDWKGDSLDLQKNSSLTDSFGRSFQYLRLSVTDVCNFSCVYCLPGGYEKPKHCEEPLSLSEIKNLISGFAKLGLWKVRLTGGEPTVRRDIVEIARVVSQVPGIRRVALTTNGNRLSKLAKPLREAGVTALNVSVDSLNSQRFYEMTGQDRLKEVLHGIDCAFEAGFETVKINVVLMKECNDHDLESFLAWAKSNPVSIRFIELMQTGKNLKLFQKHHLSAGVIQFKLLQANWQMQERKEGDGPAIEFKHPDYQGSIGLIAPYSKEFCKSCNRLRVSSTGGLRMCLFGEQDYPLRDYLKSEEDQPELLQAVRSLIDRKTKSHLLQEGKYGNTWNLASIGG